MQIWLRPVIIATRAVLLIDVSLGWRSFVLKLLIYLRKVGAIPSLPRKPSQTGPCQLFNSMYLHFRLLQHQYSDLRRSFSCSYLRYQIPNGDRTPGIPNIFVIWVSFFQICSKPRYNVTFFSLCNVPANSSHFCTLSHITAEPPLGFFKFFKLFNKNEIAAPAISEIYFGVLLFQFLNKRFTDATYLLRASWRRRFCYRALFTKRLRLCGKFRIPDRPSFCQSAPFSWFPMEHNGLPAPGQALIAAP